MRRGDGQIVGDVAEGTPARAAAATAAGSFAGQPGRGACGVIGQAGEVDEGQEQGSVQDGGDDEASTDPCTLTAALRKSKSVTPQAASAMAAPVGAPSSRRMRMP